MGRDRFVLVRPFAPPLVRVRGERCRRTGQNETGGDRLVLVLCQDSWIVAWACASAAPRNR